ncbi:Asp-tRNA(Asn)/Glu-tRNA(Gln) amidotransferase subunit GatA [bacterium]|nr:Asp-tRNA(Asn)/Glu-tRNA(Gln) amidotransferase subunit GatA [bacterium]
MELTDLTISEIHNRLKKKEFSAKELCKAYLDRIEKEDKKIFSFLTVTKKLALSQAEKIDNLIAKREKLPILAGVPAAIKDIILVKDVRCTAGSKILENYTAIYDATVIKKLKTQGVVILGKTNLDEFAMGSSTENSAFFKTKNPHDLSRVPGGSSGGSAAAVAANLCTFALGTDTGGSIRQPASFCGIVGLKPTYGAVSRYGLIAFASSLDQIGPITKTVEDAKIVFDVIKGRDEMDSTSIGGGYDKGLGSPYRQVSKGYVTDKRYRNRLRNRQTLNNLRFGVPKEYFIEGMDPEVEEIIKEAIKKFETLGAKIEEISLPHTEYALPCYYIIAPSEASANLARYDAIRYGELKTQNSKVKTLIDYYFKIRGEGFGEEVRRRIMLGTYALSAGYYEAYYKRALKVRTLVKQDFEKAFQKVDLILTPVSPTPAFKLGERVLDPLKMYLSDIFTVPVNLAGLPAISIPAGKVKNKLPVGLQIIGQAFREEEIFKVASLFEEANL